MKYSLKVIKECHFENLESFIPKICISCSLFRMKSPYRDFDKYIYSFKSWVNKVPKEAYVRLYVDTSVLDYEGFTDLMDYKKFPRLEIVFYEFEDFKIDDTFHDGVFGMMTRFMVLFDKPKIPKSVEYIWISNSNLKVNELSYENISNMKKYNVDVSHFSMACYPDIWIPNNVKFPFVNSKLIIRTSSLRNIRNKIFKGFEEFLNDVLNGKYEDVKEKIYEEYREQNGESKHNRKLKDVKLFQYGFDEIFTNTHLYNIFKMEKFKILVYLNIIYQRILYPYVSEEDVKNIKEIRESFYQNNLSKNTIIKKLKSVQEKIYNEIKDKKLLETLSPRSRNCINQFHKYASKKNDFIDNSGFVKVIYMI